MSSKRGYGEACPVAHSLDVIGDRWALLVLRELRLGPRRFTDLQAALPQAGPTILSQRLRELESHGVIERRSQKLYALTPWGAELEPVFRALARWGMQSPNEREGDVTNDTVMLGVRTFWKAPSPSWTADFTIRLGDDGYYLSIVDGEIASLFRGEPPRAPSAVLATDRHTFARLTSRELTLPAAQRNGTVALSGDPAVARQLIVALGSRKN